LTKMNRTLGTTLVLSAPTDDHLKKICLRPYFSG